MIILTKTGFTQNSPCTFFVLVFLITLGIAVIFDYMVGKLDNVIVKHLVKEKNRLFLYNLWRICQ